MYLGESTRSVPRYGIGSRLPVVCLRCFDPRKLYFHETSGKQRTRRQLVRKCPTSPLLLTERELLPNRTRSHTRPSFAEDSSVLEHILSREWNIHTGYSIKYRNLEIAYLLYRFFDQISIEFSLANLCSNSELVAFHRVD